MPASAIRTAKEQSYAERQIEEGRSNRARVLAAAREIVSRGGRPFGRVIAGQLGLSGNVASRHIRNLKKSGEWPWGEWLPMAGFCEDRAGREERARRMVVDPAVQGVFRRVVRRFARANPRLADELESQAWVSLWEIALQYREGMEMPMDRFFAVKLWNSLIDAGRSWTHRGKAATRQEPEDGRGVPLVDLAASGDPDVGWALESEDAVLSILRAVEMTDRERSIMRSIYLGCSRNRAEIARKHGVSEPWLRMIHADCLGRMRGVFRDSGPSGHVSRTTSREAC